MLLQHRPESISKSAAQDLTFVIKHPLNKAKTMINYIKIREVDLHKLGFSYIFAS